jgi:hypothetical protein
MPESRRATPARLDTAYRTWPRQVLRTANYLRQYGGGHASYAVAGRSTGVQHWRQSS